MNVAARQRIGIVVSEHSVERVGVSARVEDTARLASLRAFAALTASLAALSTLVAGCGEEGGADQASSAAPFANGLVVANCHGQRRPTVLFELVLPPRPDFGIPSLVWFSNERPRAAAIQYSAGQQLGAFTLYEAVRGDPDSGIAMTGTKTAVDGVPVWEVQSGMRSTVSWIDGDRAFSV